MRKFCTPREVHYKDPTKSLHAISANCCFESTSFIPPCHRHHSLVPIPQATLLHCRRLLCRHYDRQEGALLVDGKDIKAHTQRSVRSALGVESLPHYSLLLSSLYLQMQRWRRWERLVGLDPYVSSVASS